MQRFIAHLIVPLNIGRVEDERLLGRLDHADMAELVDEETAFVRVEYGRPVAFLPEFLQVRRIRSVLCDGVFFTSEHSVVSCVCLTFSAM